MKHLLLFVIFPIYIINHSVAQEYQDLLIMYVDEKYDKCFDKAVKYTESDKTSKDALPYLYASMASFEMSRDHEYVDDFPKAFSTALSYGAKYRKKDPEDAYKEDSREYIEKLKMIIAEEVENYLLEGSEKGYGKSASLLKKINAIDTKDFGAMLLWGYLEIESKNKTEGKKILSEGFRLIKTIGTDVQFGDMTESQQYYLRMALMAYAKSQREKDPAGAKETISIGHQYFYEEREDCFIKGNEKFKELYDDITG